MSGELKEARAEIRRLRADVKRLIKQYQDGRREALEEAARVADEFPSDLYDTGRIIRSLASQEKTND